MAFSYPSTKPQLEIENDTYRNVSYNSFNLIYRTISGSASNQEYGIIP